MAEFAARMRPAPTAPAADEELKALVGRRRQLVAMLAAEKNRRHQAAGPIRKSLDRTIRALERELGTVDQAIERKLAESAQLSRQRKLLRAVPGVGPVVCATLIVRLPELGQLSRRGSRRPARGSGGVVWAVRIHHQGTKPQSETLLRAKPAFRLAP